MYLFRCDFADDTYTKSRSWEGLTIDKLIRKSEKGSDFSYFVLEEQTKRLNDLLEINMIRKSAYVVVALDDR